jgi:hypothetical protein
MSRTIRLVSDRIRLGIKDHLGLEYIPFYGTSERTFGIGRLYVFGVQRKSADKSNKYWMPERTAQMSTGDTIISKRFSIDPGTTMKIEIDCNYTAADYLDLRIDFDDDSIADINVSNPKGIIKYTNESAVPQTFVAIITATRANNISITASGWIDRQAPMWGHNVEYSSTSPFTNYPSNRILIAEWELAKFENVTCNFVFGQQRGETQANSKIHIRSNDSKFIIFPYRWNRNGFSKADMLVHFDMYSPDGTASGFLCKEADLNETLNS